MAVHKQMVKSLEQDIGERFYPMAFKLFQTGTLLKIEDIQTESVPNEP